MNFNKINDKESKKRSLKNQLEGLVLTAALAFAVSASPLQAAPVQNNIRNTSAVKDTCNCGPKYEELNFLDSGRETDIFGLSCDSSSTQNILELIDFKDKTIKNNILSRNYTTIEDNLGRDNIRIQTRRGTRYFTIQPRNKKDQGIIGIDGTVNYDRLRNHGNKMLKLYIQVGSSAGLDSRTGKIKIHPLDSGDLIIPYCDCIQPVIQQVINYTTKTDTVFSTIKTTEFVEDTKSKERLLNIEGILQSEQLHVSVLGSFANNTKQNKLYECGEFDIKTKPIIMKFLAYAQVVDALHLNAEFTHLHGEASFSDSARNHIGDYGITADDLLVDARFNALDLDNLGLGIGTIFEYNASTQNGNLQQYDVSGNGKRASGLLGIVAFADNPNLNAGLYLGNSNQLGNLFNATARVNNLPIGEFLDVNSRLFFERYDGDYGKGNRSGFEVFASGPLLIGCLRPTLGYETTKTIYLRDENKLEKGSRNSVFVGVTADIGKLIDKTFK